MEATWKRASRSEGANNCVELHPDGAVRDSKNPDGPILEVELGGLVSAVKAGRLAR